MLALEHQGGCEAVKLAYNACIALALLACLSARADTFVGEVIGLSDGDTITVLDASNVRHKIRLAGIDAPESKQAFGNVSKQHLAELVFRKHVTVEGQKLDRFGRTVGKVYLGELDVCLEQIRAGLAWWFEKYQSDQTVEDRLSYREAESIARARRIGLWADPDPIAPWGFRHR